MKMKRDFFHVMFCVMPANEIRRQKRRFSWRIRVKQKAGERVLVSRSLPLSDRAGRARVIIYKYITPSFQRFTG